MEILQEGGAVAGETSAGRPCEHLGSGYALLLLCGQAACEHGLSDQRERNPLVEGCDGRPFAGTLLAGGIEDVVEHIFAVVVLLGEDVAGNLNQIAVEVALVPFCENLVHLLVAHA